MYNSNKSASLKYFKKAVIYKNSTGSCIFDPSTLEARSYNWWVFVRRIEGLVVFNDYRYSVSTSKHQTVVKALMQDLGIKIDIELPCRKGLQVYHSLDELIETAEIEVCDQWLAKKLRAQDKYQERKSLQKTQSLIDEATKYVEERGAL